MDAQKCKYPDHNSARKNFILGYIFIHVYIFIGTCILHLVKLNHFFPNYLFLLKFELFHMRIWIFIILILICCWSSMTVDLVCVLVHLFICSICLQKSSAEDVFLSVSTQQCPGKHVCETFSKCPRTSLRTYNHFDLVKGCHNIRIKWVCFKLKQSMVLKKKIWYIYHQLPL